mgnify:CR=1 FL=1|jgi:hypothetical protein
MLLKVKNVIHNGILELFVKLGYLQNNNATTFKNN